MSNDAEGRRKSGHIRAFFGRGAAEPEPQGVMRPPSRPPQAQLAGAAVWRIVPLVSSHKQGHRRRLHQAQLDALTLEELEDVLLRADLGVAAPPASPGGRRRPL